MEVLYGSLQWEVCKLQCQSEQEEVGSVQSRDTKKRSLVTCQTLSYFVPSLSEHGLTVKNKHTKLQLAATH